MNRACKLSPDCFCYVCGYDISPPQRKHEIMHETKFSIAYEAYFGVKMGDQDKSWAPHVCCGSCRFILEGRLRGSRKSMPFAIQRIWREPSNHRDNCYFCMVDISQYTKPRDRKNIFYPNISSSIAPVSHNPDLPIPQRCLTQGSSSHALSATASFKVEAAVWDDVDNEADEVSIRDGLE